MLEIGALEFTGAQVFDAGRILPNLAGWSGGNIANPRLIVEFIMRALFEYSWLLRPVIMVCGQSFSPTLLREHRSMWSSVCLKKRRRPIVHPDDYLFSVLPDSAVDSVKFEIENLSHWRGGTQRCERRMPPFLYWEIVEWLRLKQVLPTIRKCIFINGSTINCAKYNAKNQEIITLTDRIIYGRLIT